MQKKRTLRNVPDNKSRRAISVRLAAYYTANFAKGGVQFPWWQVFLEGRGFSTPEIGWLMGVRFWVGFLSGPLIARVADRCGERRRIMIALAVGMFFSYWLYLYVDSFWAFAFIGIVVAAFQAPIGPLGDSLTIINAQRSEVDYGRVRLWGSASFIVTVLLAGIMLENTSSEAILWAIIALSFFIVIGCWFLPDTRVEPKVLHWTATFRLLFQPTFALFIITVAFLQTSHAILYGFGTIYWIENGISKTTIALLWVEGVIAEIILFWFGTKLNGRYGPVGLMIFAAIAGVLRWTLTGLSLNIWILGFAQLLHAFTFGAAYLGAMEFLKQAAPQELAASAQALFNAIAMGLAFAIALPLAGYVFAEFGGASYWLMAVLSAIGGGGALLLGRLWMGQRLEIRAE